MNFNDDVGYRRREREREREGKILDAALVVLFFRSRVRSRRGDAVLHLALKEPEGPEGGGGGARSGDFALVEQFSVRT